MIEATLPYLPPDIHLSSYRFKGSTALVGKRGDKETTLIVTYNMNYVPELGAEYFIGRLS